MSCHQQPGLQEFVFKLHPIWINLTPQIVSCLITKNHHLTLFSQRKSQVMVTLRSTILLPENLVCTSRTNRAFDFRNVLTAWWPMHSTCPRS